MNSYESGKTSYHGRLKRQTSNTLLKYVIIEAAWSHRRWAAKSSDVVKFGRRVMRRRVAGKQHGSCGHALATSLVAIGCCLSRSPGMQAAFVGIWAAHFRTSHLGAQMMLRAQINHQEFSPVGKRFARPIWAKRMHMIGERGTGLCRAQIHFPEATARVSLVLLV